MKTHILISLLMFCFNFRLYAEIRFPAIIGNHMVLQQKSDVRLWGWCEPGEHITIRVGWDTATYTTTGNNNAKWSLKVKSF